MGGWMDGEGARSEVHLPPTAKLILTEPTPKANRPVSTEAPCFALVIQNSPLVDSLFSIDVDLLQSTLRGTLFKAIKMKLLYVSNKRTPNKKHLVLTYE